MAINATNYDGTKDYKIAETGDVYHPNLALNGDFQINQRGKSSYTNSTNDYQYSVDMWCTTKAIVTKTSSGVTVSPQTTQSGYFLQLIPCDKTTKTLVTKVNGKIYTLVYSGSDVNTDFSDGTGGVTLEYKNNRQDIVYYVNQGKQINIEYADLFEGNIAYAHVKEDYADALLRCQQYFYPVALSSYMVPAFPLYFSSIRSDLCIPISLPTKMKNNPTVDCSIGGIYNNATAHDEGTNVRIESNFATQYGMVRIKKNDGSDFTSGSFYVVLNKLLLSCEPL